MPFWVKQLVEVNFGVTVFLFPIRLPPVRYVMSSCCCLFLVVPRTVAVTDLGMADVGLADFGRVWLALTGRRY